MIFLFSKNRHSPLAGTPKRLCRDQLVSGYTLTELVVVIFFCLALAGFFFYLFHNAQEQTHSAQCQADVKQMQAALALYFNLEHHYPATWTAGQALTAPTSGKVIMLTMPTNQSLWLEQACSDVGADYIYAASAQGYSLSFCLDGQTENYGPAVTEQAQNSAPVVAVNPGAPNSEPASSSATSAVVISTSTVPTTSTPSTGSGQASLPTGQAGSVPAANCPQATCTGDTPYYNQTTKSCTDTAPTVQTDPLAMTLACNSCDDYGALCGGGYLFCKPSDAICNNQFAVAATVDLAGAYTFDQAQTACAAYAAYGFSGWVVPGVALQNPWPAKVQAPTEMCTLMRRSSVCRQQTVAGKCTGGCLENNKHLRIPIDGLKYWTGTAYDATTAWMEYSQNARPGYTDKTDTYSVRCIRRF